MTEDAAWSALFAELDRWAHAGKRLELWLRDDDATEPSDQLDRLADLAGRFTIPVLLASIPLQAQETLAKRLETAPLLLPCQHGTWHRNHAPTGEKKSEFGLHRPTADIAAEIAAGRQRLRDLFGHSFLSVFVPPWNRIHPEIAAELPGLGFAGLSCFRNFALGPAGGPRLVNTDLDLIDWHHGRVGRQPDNLLAEMVQLLADRQMKPQPRQPFGLLLHHHDHDSTTWSFLTNLLSRLSGHAAVAFSGPDTLFDAATYLD
ncbi:polysaccharide deacetylase family protein [Bosea sp. (in: a-proteobacteria)]|uniref:polysaccharide deacetylase family protein n=1 Tax=Bosea sp. (in: a-proteobacteria) TaxID=1871050 RepID=UPI002DDD99F9|nr:polysaccharide deacetylase family protein [Bosea sp. (in: a-proteobacteria)]HEV2510609.1 polysaccharide deacetylase family protein [Bosea sp. (in: a-proteobacteria)]